MKEGQKTWHAQPAPTVSPCRTHRHRLQGKLPLFAFLNILERLSCSRSIVRPIKMSFTMKITLENQEPADTRVDYEKCACVKSKKPRPWGGVLQKKPQQAPPPARTGGGWGLTLIADGCLLLVHMIHSLLCVCVCVVCVCGWVHSYFISKWYSVLTAC